MPLVDWNAFDAFEIRLDDYLNFPFVCVCVNMGGVSDVLNVHGVWSAWNISEWSNAAPKTANSDIGQVGQIEGSSSH